MTLHRHIWKRLLCPALSSSLGLTTTSVRLKSSKILRTRDPFYREGVSDVIDVRTPEEYHADHIPGAINIPILSPEEFQIVGSNKSGKSLIMRKLIDRGHQVLNFDKMIHYEDLFLSGDLMKMKGRTRYMETKLRDKLVSFDPSRPVWVKHQLWQTDLMKRVASTHNLSTPPVLYKQMIKGKIYEVRVPNEEKVERLVRQGYLDWMKDNLDTVQLFLDTHARNMYEPRILNIMHAHTKNGKLRELLAVTLQEEHRHYKNMRRRCRKKFAKNPDLLRQEFFVLDSLTSDKIEEIVEKFEKMAENS
ncbi:uncharacterized protein LOC110456626 isoform X3 [Mizuhopecten yessoensis]|uniref:uncharacterized protein LOC110456626 isoform X3 n=1 Tax=Mizuhopecten yessoensis TaxID=6573 RepID=UPI000B457BB3|nr:uncharacterized protein LOC110456626 isoform X3 [Mizuhopecten yessoensis]